MLKKATKKFFSKGIYWVVRVLPIVIPALLIFSANSTACTVNGQPTPPENLKKYRKF